MASIFYYNIPHDPTKPITVNLKPEEYEKLKRFAEAQFIPLAAIFHKFVSEILNDPQVAEGVLQCIGPKTYEKHIAWKRFHCAERESTIKKLRAFATANKTSVPRLFRSYLQLSGII